MTPPHGEGKREHLIDSFWVQQKSQSKAKIKIKHYSENRERTKALSYEK